MFNEKYSEILNIVKEDIIQVQNILTDEIDVKEPLKSKLFAILNAPSKHIRALVSFLYLRAAGENIDYNQILYQSAIELVHNASLIHDDIIDESIERRNTETLNKTFSNKLAVITGDYLLSIGLNRILKIGNPCLIKMFNDTLSIMCTGEINQLFNRFEIPKLEEYIEKSYQKTAKLFETALCGALIISESKLNGYDFAKNFGIAFQIRDDIVNCKTSNSDIKNGIYTAPVIFSGDITNIENGIEKSQILLNNYIDNAVSNISNLKENKYKTALIELLELLRYE